MVHRGQPDQRTNEQVKVMMTNCKAGEMKQARFVWFGAWRMGMANSSNWPEAMRHSVVAKNSVCSTTRAVKK
jgi:hypothetical protein